MSDENISSVAKRVSDVSVEIDTLTQQIQPVVERIKELKELKKQLKEQLQQDMSQSNIQRVSTPAVQIALKSNTQKCQPFNRATVQKGLAELFSSRKVDIDAADAVAFIDEYRKTHKVDAGASVSFRKSTDYTPPTVQGVQPLKVTIPDKNAGLRSPSVPLYDI